MNALQREQQAARLRTLRLISEDGLTLNLREPLYCKPELKGWRVIPKCEIR